MLEIKDVDAGYKRFKVLQGINLKVKKGEILSIIGANGAGKTTLFRTISGILAPNTGKVLFQGKDITGMAPHSIVRIGVGQVPEGRQVVPNLSVIDHLYLAANYGGRYSSKNEINKKLEEIYQIFPVLEERKYQLAGSLSGGQQQMLVISRALMIKPNILLFDEPSLGLAPIIVAKIFKTLKSLNKEGMTILLIEQNAFAALKISHRAYIMEHGKVVMEDDAEKLLKDDTIRSYYLG